MKTEKFDGEKWTLTTISCAVTMATVNDPGKTSMCKQYYEQWPPPAITKFTPHSYLGYMHLPLRELEDLVTLSLPTLATKQTITKSTHTLTHTLAHGTASSQWVLAHDKKYVAKERPWSVSHRKNLIRTAKKDKMTVWSSDHLSTPNITHRPARARKQARIATWHPH